MAHPYHHALSSVRTWGGVPDDYIRLHHWFDESKSILADYRHRALRHHAEGIFMLETIFGSTLTLSCGRRLANRNKQILSHRAYCCQPLRRFSSSVC